MATLQDIAREANCSVCLVSYVLKKTTPPTKEKHKRILEIAQSMNYVSNKVAAALVTGRTNNIALIVGGDYYQTLHTPFFAEFLYELTNRMTEQGFGISLYATTNDSEKIKDIVLNGMCDGVIWYLDAMPEEVKYILKSRKIPSLILFNSQADADMDYLCIDDYSSEYHLMQYLYDQNHRHILYGGNDSGARYQAYVDFIRNNHLPFQRNLQGLENADFKNKRVLEEYIQKYGMDFTAIACVQDSIAISLIYALKYLGYSVPETVSVVGYDDLPDASRCSPMLTTIHQNYKEIAEKTTDYFAKRVVKREEVTALQEVFIQDIIKRESVKMLDT